MGFRRNREDDAAAAVVATSRWTQAAEGVSQRFRQIDDLPLDEAVEVTLMRVPGSMDRQDLTRRMAASRGLEPPLA